VFNEISVSLVRKEGRNAERRSLQSSVNNLSISAAGKESRKVERQPWLDQSHHIQGDQREASDESVADASVYLQSEDRSRQRKQPQHQQQQQTKNQQQYNRNGQSQQERSKQLSNQSGSNNPTAKSPGVVGERKSNLQTNQKYPAESNSYDVSRSGGQLPSRSSQDELGATRRGAVSSVVPSSYEFGAQIASSNVMSDKRSSNRRGSNRRVPGQPGINMGIQGPVQLPTNQVAPVVNYPYGGYIPPNQQPPLPLYQNQGIVPYGPQPQYPQYQVAPQYQSGGQYLNQVPNPALPVVYPPNTGHLYPYSNPSHGQSYIPNRPVHQYPGHAGELPSRDGQPFDVQDYYRGYPRPAVAEQPINVAAAHGGHRHNAADYAWKISGFTECSKSCVGG